MTTPDLRRRLLRISTAEKKTLLLFAEGVSHTSAFGLTIDDLTNQAAAERLKLGEHFLKVANRMSTSTTRDWRSVIGRYYYAMYHGARAVVFFQQRGDDFQEHNKLPNILPDDFPNKDLYANELKDARSRRNEADYDIYLGGTPHFRRSARVLAPTAASFVSACRTYLTTKGCKYI